jgi:DNA-binding response OmpR family regulator
MSDTSLPNRVLVVDDDPMLGRLLLRYLSRAGIPADSADSVATAQAAFKPGIHSHAVVDLTLPDGSGADWLVTAFQQDANLIGVLSSGYPVTTEFLPENLRHRATTLQKPFSPPDLLLALGIAAQG